MTEFERSVLYVGTAGAASVSRERALVASGIRVACVVAPESAVSYVKENEAPVVLLDDASAGFHLSSLAGALKVANSDVRVIALVKEGHAVNFADVILEKPIAIESLLSAVEQNLPHSGYCPSF